TFQLAGQVEFSLNLFTLQTQGHSLLLTIALAGQGQLADLGVAGTDLPRLQAEVSLLLLIETCFKDQAGDTLLIQTQLLALQIQPGLRCFARAGQIQAPVGAAAQTRPQLIELAQRQIHLALQLPVQAAAPLNAVVAQAQIQTWQLPGRSCCVGIQQQRSGLATELALQFNVRLQLQILSLQSAFAAQPTAQLPRQFCDPVRRIELLQLQGGFPRDGVSEAQAQLSFGASLPSLNL